MQTRRSWQQTRSKLKRHGHGAITSAENYQNGKALGGEGEAGLSASLFKSVNEGLPLTMTVFGADSLANVHETVQDARKRIEKSKVYIKSPDAVEKSDCFIPAAWEYKQAEALFVIAPQYNMKLKFVTVDIKILHHLLKGTSIRITQAQAVKNSSELFEKAFYLPAKTADNMDDSTTKIFADMIRTDGTAIDFLCARRPTDDTLPTLFG